MGAAEKTNRKGATMRRLAAELFGTFALVFAGTGAVVINDVSGGTVTHVGVALTFGLVVLAMILAADRRLVGIVLLVEAIIPLGDMSIILASGGSRSRAFSVHGVTCAVMLVVGLLLIHAI